MDLLKIAWRNVWRNQRRTFVTIAAMSFGLFVMILYAAMLEGYARSGEGVSAVDTALAIKKTCAACHAEYR